MATELILEYFNITSFQFVNSLLDSHFVQNVLSLYAWQYMVVV